MEEGKDDAIEWKGVCPGVPYDSLQNLNDGGFEIIRVVEMCGDEDTGLARNPGYTSTIVLKIELGLVLINIDRGCVATARRE